MEKKCLSIVFDILSDEKVCEKQKEHSGYVNLSCSYTGMQTTLSISKRYSSS